MTILQMGVLLFLFHRALRVHRGRLSAAPCPCVICNRVRT
jgi:hypothetical protein